jgi:DNA mismatch endonuclease (patch repair protein)
MVGNRGRDTKPELALRSAVHALGLRYRVGARLPGMRRTADLLFERAKVAVFVDGCFWHGCATHCRVPSTNREYWLAKTMQNGARDKDTDTKLRAAGWTVVRVWEHEDTGEAALSVATAVATRSRLQSLSP